MKKPENNGVIYEFGNCVLDPTGKTLFVDGKAVHLAPKEFDTLLLLVEQNGKALSKEEMMAAVWQDAFVEDGNLAKQISHLRKILNTNGNELIETIPKHGYRFLGEVIQVVLPDSETVIERRTVKRVTLSVENDVAADAPLALPPAASRFFNTPRLVALGLVVLLGAAAIWFFYPVNKGKKINSIAVLPLRSLNPDENVTLGLGLTDNLIMKIGGLRQIVVRPLSAVMPYTESPQDSLEVGRRLNVDAILEGTIQRSDGRVRLNVRLLRVENGEQIWAEQFDSEAAQFFDLQDRLTAQTAQALKLTLGANETQQIAKHYTDSTEALDAYLKGRYFWNKRTADDLRTAVGYFNDAIEKDANYALAYAGLADAYSLLADYNGAPPDEAYPKAKVAATKALALDDQLAEAHTSLAYVEMYYYRDWQQAEESYRQAISLNPNYATAHQWYAEFLTAMGRFDEALAETKRAKEIDPHSPIINAGEVWTLYFARRYDEAIERGLQIAELNPKFAEIHEYLKRCYDQKGMYADSIAARQTRRRLVGLDGSENAILRAAAAATDAKDYWRKRLEQEVVESRGESPEFFNMAEIYAQKGEIDVAFDWLDKAIKNRDYEVMYLRVAPNLDPLRSDPRFADMLRRAGLDKV